MRGGGYASDAGIERLEWPQHMKHRDRFFVCPSCGRKRLIRRRDLDMFNPSPSSLSAELQRRFDVYQTSDARYDFSCRGCGEPYRVLFVEQERGMGGPWDVVVHAVLRLAGG